jgi:hypothetical protein
VCDTRAKVLSYSSLSGHFISKNTTEQG